MKRRSQLLAGIALVIVLASAKSFAGECQTKTIKHAIDKKAAIALQDSVNEGHQPWRTDALPVAAEELLKYEAGTLKGDVYGVPLETVAETERKASFRWASPDKKRTYTIELVRPAWLLSRAKKHRWMIWLPIRTTVKACPTKSELQPTPPWKPPPSGGGL